MWVRLSPGAHMNVRIGIFILAASIVVGALYFYQRPAPSTFRIIDRCPHGQSFSLQKIPSQIERTSNEWTVTHPDFHFRFSFPDDGWRFEENTIQEREEPISLPPYVYTLLLTDGVYDENKRSPSEVRLVVYPSFCNSKNQWEEFLLTQGWKKGEERQLVRSDSGRTRSLYITHEGTFHYELEISIDPLNSKRTKEELLSLTQSFVITKGIKNDPVQ